MTDVEFIARLEQELAAKDRWGDISSVVNSEQDPSLAPNELLVIPATTGRQPTPTTALRVVVEFLTLPSPA